VDNQFKGIRYQAFYDLVNLISGEDIKKQLILVVVPANKHILSQKIKSVNFLSIDASTQMLAKPTDYRCNSKKIFISTFY